MFRPHASGKVLANNNAANSKQVTSNNNNENSPTTNTTIREIRSRTVASTTVNNNNGRSLLAHRRQAMSMERLNSGAGSTTSSTSSVGHINDKEKSSPSSGSSNSINGSPQRAVGLNRTASRVSRFRSAKAVFERLSNNNINNNNNTGGKLDKPLEKPRGTVASRYAAAAAARATTHANNNTNTVSSSPRSRTASSSLMRSQDSGKSASNIDIHRVSSSNCQQSPKSESHHPRPQPRVIPSRSTSSTTSAQQNSNNNVINTATSNEKTKTSSNLIASTNKTNAQLSKLPAQDLIDKIVFEIASDAVKQKPDPDCTIQDLSSCDISGIPETLDFDRCFQDVEMMTEEEARKLLSKKHDLPIKSSQSIDASPSNTTTNDDVDSKLKNKVNIDNKIEIDIKADSLSSEKCLPQQQSSKESVAEQDLSSTTICSNNTTISSTSTIKSKVRFSEEPAQICVTHAVEDYDRRNKDIDPIAASAEYELEKSKEREGITNDDDDDDNNNGEDNDNNNNVNSYSTTNNNSDGAVNHQFIKHQDSLNQATNNDANNPHGILIVRSPQNVPHTDRSCDPLGK